jgi:formylglycine-generating enzyme required for sulfatase activity
VAHDFTSPQTYTVTAADGSTKTYTVTVTAALNPAKDITAFSILGIPGTVGANTVTITVPYGTDLSSLTPTITITGASVSPASGVAHDFTSPQTYTVTAADGSTKDYTVIVSVGFTADGVTFNMAFVPGKSFPTSSNGTTCAAVVGSCDDAGTATVANAYLIGNTEVTYELWQKVYAWATTDAGGGKRADGGDLYFFDNVGKVGSSNSGSIQQPVTSINWRDAMVWTNAATEWYNAKKGTSDLPVYTSGGYVIRDSRETNAAACDNPDVGSGKGFRLLTSNEWELAARWRNDSANAVPGYSNPWFTKGNSASGAVDSSSGATDAVAWWQNNSPSTQVVAIRAVDGLGLYDMSGNVWEWCFGLYDATNRVIRGGAYTSASDYIQLGVIYYANPATGAEPNRGFRLARTP